MKTADKFLGGPVKEDTLENEPLEEDKLEDEAFVARLDLCHLRSMYPSLCANLLQNSIKSDIKISTTFEVDSGNDQLPIKPAFENAGEIAKLGLKRKTGISYEKIKDLESQMKQISAALELISKNKSTI